MIVKQMMVGLTCAVALSHCVMANETNEVETAENESSIVSANAGIAFDSKYMSYGFVDNRDPIVTPSAELTFFETVTLGVEAIFDVTRYGRQAGYGNRQWRYQELHPYAGISHGFSPEDYEWLPTTIELGLSYLYEYHPSCKGRHGDPGMTEDSQFITLDVALPDLWFEPALSIERDFMRDDGTYVNFEVGHTFALIDGESEDDDPILALRPSVGQGFGNCERVKAYACKENGEPLGHSGLMDTSLKLELTWNVCDHFAISAYGMYSDFVFDRSIRHAARDYEATGRWDESWNFVGGLAATISF